MRGNLETEKQGGFACAKSTINHLGGGGPGANPDRSAVEIQYRDV